MGILQYKIQIIENYPTAAVGRPRLITLRKEAPQGQRALHCAD